MYIITQYTPHILIALLVLVIALFVATIILARRISKLTLGKSAKSLEGTIKQIVDYQAKSEQHSKNTDTKIRELNTRLSSSVRGIGLVRFNPFAGSGESRPSFAISLLNEQGMGVIISTLDARGSVTIFTKQVSNFSPESELSSEESQALDKARNSLHNS